MSKKNNTAAAGLLAGLDAGHRQATQDAKLEAKARQPATMLLQAIKERANEDTREPRPEEVEAMAETVEAVGLIQPLAVDIAGRLLAGKTRLLALRKLHEAAPEKWERVPVRVFDFDSKKEPQKALAVEVAENEKRTDYTRAEIAKLAERLKAMGFKATAGPPRRGQKALVPALSLIVGKSQRTVMRALAESKRPKAAEHKPQAKQPQKDFTELRKRAQAAHLRLKELSEALETYKPQGRAERSAMAVLTEHRAAFERVATVLAVIIGGKSDQ